MLKKILFCICISVLFKSCMTPTVQSFVNSDGNHPKPEARTYWIETISKQKDQYSEEYENLLEKVLAKHGYSRIRDENNADVIISLDYSSEEIYFSYLSSEPIRTKTRAKRVLVPAGASVDAEGVPSQRYVAVNQPERIESRPKLKYDQYFQKTIMIIAYKNVPLAHFEDTDIHWAIEIISTEDDPDLHRVFPFMLAAADAYVGRSSLKQKKIQIKADNPLLQSLLNNEKESDFKADEKS